MEEELLSQELQVSMNVSAMVLVFIYKGPLKWMCYVD